MADNFKQNNKDAKEYYETQQRIAEVIKRQTDNWTTFGEAQKEVSKNAKAIRALNEEILKLSKSEVAEERAKAEELKKQKDYLVELNKEMLKTKTLAQAVRKSFKEWSINKLTAGFDNILDRYNRMDRSAREAAINVGMSVTRMNQFRGIVAQSQSELTKMGVELEKAGQMQEAFSDATGNQVMLTKESLITMAALAKTTGMAEEEMAGLVGQMGDFGMGAASARGMLSAIAQRTNKMGLNTKNVMKKITQNMSLLNKLSFKNGVAGLAKMARYSEKFKLSMEATAAFAEKVMRPEGAIDAAANLQVLGGSLAQMGDAFQLMGQARNNPEEFMKTITKAASETAQWDQASKSFKVSAYQMDRLREASEATGISVEELVATAKQTAKVNMFGNLIKISGDDKEFLSGIMELDDKGQAFLFDEKGHKQYLKDLSSTQQQDIANKLKADKETEKERAIARQTSQDLLVNNLNALLDKLMPAMKALDDSFRPKLEEWLKKLESLVNYFVKNPWIAKLVLAIMAFVKLWPIISAVFSPLVWFLRGKMLAKGFESSISKSGALKKVMGGGDKSDMVQSKKGDWYKSDSPQGKMIRTKGGTQPLGGGQSGAAAGANPSQVGESSGKSAGNMLKGAAAILVLSAALFVFAKALQEFDKLQNGWQTLTMAAFSLIILSGALFLVGQIMGKATTNILMGSVAILALGVALIPFAYAMQMIKDVGVGTMLGAALALAAFALAAGLMGAFLPFILLGSIAIVALSGALMLFGLALQIVAPGMEMFLSSLSKLPSLIGPLFLFGPALGIAALGIGALSISLFALGAAWWFGGSAFKDLTGSLAAMKGLDLSGMSKSVSAINRVDLEKIEALRDLALSLSLVNLFGGIKVEFGDIDVNGTINLKSGSGVSKGTDWVNDPVFVSKLKNLIWESMHKGKKGGKA